MSWLKIPRSALRPPSGELPAIDLVPLFWNDDNGRRVPVVHRPPKPEALGVIMEKIGRREKIATFAGAATVPAIIPVGYQSANTPIVRMGYPVSTQPVANTHVIVSSPATTTLRATAEESYDHADDLPYPTSRFSAYSANTDIALVPPLRFRL
jgi:hypothetical protein